MRGQSIWGLKIRTKIIIKITNCGCGSFYIFQLVGLSTKVMKS